MSSSTAHCTNNCANGLAAHQGDSTMAEVRIFPTCPIPVFGRRSSRRIGSVALEVRRRRGRRTCGLTLGFRRLLLPRAFHCPGRSLQSNSLCMRADP